MLLLKLQLTIQHDQTKFPRKASPFFGGVFHGAFEHLVRRHEPAIARELGMFQDSPLKYYAILPPPYDWQPPRNNGTSLLNCGIMLFGKTRQSVHKIAPLLQHWREIRLDERVDYIKQCTIHICNPGTQPVLWCEINQKSIENFTLDFNHAFAASDGIRIDLITPLILESEQQKTIGVNTTPPGLLRIIRSATRRIRKLEPQLALSLGMQSSEWVEAEEQIRHLPITAHTLKQVEWTYGSRTKPRPILRKGLIGRIDYTGHIPAMIVAALNWGCWFGIGQGTAMGQGMYTVSTSEKE